MLILRQSVATTLLYSGVVSFVLLKGTGVFQPDQAGRHRTSDPETSTCGSGPAATRPDRIGHPVFGRARPRCRVRRVRPCPTTMAHGCSVVGIAAQLSTLADCD